jgi:two-component SAPR family response regulator
MRLCLDLFGEERGQISLSAVLSVRILDEDSNVLAIQSTDRKTRFFKGETNTDVEEWVSAIRSAGQATKTKPNIRRSINSTVPFVPSSVLEDDADRTEVTVQIITVKAAEKQLEYVAARSPSWDRVITICDFRKGS